MGLFVAISRSICIFEGVIMGGLVVRRGSFCQKVDGSPCRIRIVLRGKGACLVGKFLVVFFLGELSVGSVRALCFEVG